MTGQGRLYGDLGRGQVANLPHQDDVGGTAQHGLQDAREAEPNAIGHLHLVDASDVVLDGILGGDDLDVGAVEFLQGGVGVLIEAGGTIYGAVGVSGAPSGETDEACAKAGVGAVIDDLEMAD